jgi:hypothetical protein
MNLTANIMPRRTCDTHGWDGGGDCPWCEIVALRKRLEAAERRLVETILAWRAGEKPEDYPELAALAGEE